MPLRCGGTRASRIRARRTPTKDQRGVLGDKIERQRKQVERDRLDVILSEIALPPCFDALAETGAAFCRAADDGALLDLAVAIRPAERDVHREIECPEALAAFWWSPRGDEAVARDDAFDDVGKLRSAQPS